ncbi:MAG: methylated-DNA--[protein]-cysteine S-methyltransferase [Mycobacteriaceae bacterium]|nr:methylated-DNA--[protein]-cysteine S-methyltransferase [Mycobacteriaceae bacterium]
MTAYYSTTATHIGPFTAVVDDGDQVIAAGWTADVNALIAVVHPTLRPDTLRHSDSLGAVTSAVTAYHDGDVQAIDGIPVRQRSGEFLEHAWGVLRKVPAGEPITYTQFADLAGRPAAVRAAASACARNAAALFVPCHRIVRTDGTLGGFRWGLPVKRQLLAHEAATTQP